MGIEAESCRPHRAALWSVPLLVLALSTGCGDHWDPHQAEATFALDCSHAEAACSDCHPDGEPIAAVETECIACHETDWPESHDRAETRDCTECHGDQTIKGTTTTSTTGALETCGWDAASPHPSGYDDPDLHGLDFKLQDFATEGECTECHGTDLDGGEAQGCDTCHEAEGLVDWRTDCVLCHGGTDNETGAPPVDMDDQATDLSFLTHSAHVTDDDGDYRASACTDCHLDQRDILDPGHILDGTPEVSEVDFSRSIAEAATWSPGTCSDVYCHGAGFRGAGGEIDDGAPAMDCESCHATESGWGAMSGLHESHLSEQGIVCNDCHAAIIDATGRVVTPARHVDGLRDISMFEPTITTPNNGGTCQGSCHGYDHQDAGWGHPPGYDEPWEHGVDANLQLSDCGSCHGFDWFGGIAQGCDDCHTQEGHSDWRTDCVFCHGDAADGTGAPPQDIDDESDPTLISFQGHPEHGLGGDHPAYGCEQCHSLVPLYADAREPEHMLDGTPGVAEVDLSVGLSDVGGWDAATLSCSNMYCHGNGRAPSGTIADGETDLGCDDCHATTTGWAGMSGTHETHLTEGALCSECHAPIVDAGGQVVSDDRHVDGTLDLDNGSTGFNPSSRTCTVNCHGVDHSGWGWLGPHPEGYDAPEAHGQEALNWILDCTSCHGTDLRGGTASSCDGSCHDPDWRSDCAWCHGGENGDVDGLPPQDLDNETDEDLISFKAHPEHADGDAHPLWGCETCHGAGAGAYTDAFTDPGHWADPTSEFAEVVFTGLAAGTVYAANTCSNNVCHGDGQTVGSQADGPQALDCNGCHAYDSFLTDLSGTHAAHLTATGVTCADCHAPVVDAAGNITTPNQHVNGNLEFDTNATGYDPVSDTCTISCHNQDHSAWSWEGGHPPGYDLPDVHSPDALLILSDCRSCHGSDLQGGTSGQGCDSCHPNQWRADCTFCHGGTVDNSGAPPQDIDGTTNESQITFMAHPEHGDGDAHPLYGCPECHGSVSDSFVDALTDPGHWYDATPGISEVDFDGLSSGGTYNNGTCSNLYCHGNGRTNGSESDSNNSLNCSACHSMPPNSGEHNDHDHDNYPCAECHALTANSADVIIGPNRHVDGNVDVDMNAALNSVTWNGNTCSGSCHGEGHSNENW